MIKLDSNRTCFEPEKITTNHKPDKLIWQLECDEWQAVKIALASTLCYTVNPSSKEFDDIMGKKLSGKLCDIEDIVDIEYVKY